MAGYKVSDYAVGNPNWTELMETIEKQRKGKITLSLTNYDNDNLPAIEAGSFVECVGAYYGFIAEEAIGGSPDTGKINYIVFDPTPITFSWSIVAPVWSSAKNAWMDAGEAKRYVGGCYYDGTYYKVKKVDSGHRETLSTLKTLVIPLVGELDTSTDRNEVSFYGAFVWFASTITASRGGNIEIQLPDGAIVIKIEAWSSTITAGTPDCTLYFRLRRSANDVFTEDDMAEWTITEGQNYGSDSSISYAVINSTGYGYFINFIITDTHAIERMYGIKITYLSRD